MSTHKDRSLPESKSLEFRREIRKKELNEFFGSVRKEMMKEESQKNTEPQYKSPVELTQQEISQKISKLYFKSQEYGQALDSLWRDCLENQKVQRFTKESISKLCQEVIRLKNSNDKEGKEIQMLVWIIANWCYHYTSLPPQIAQLVPDLLELLSLGNSQKLNHLIIYLFTNTCCTESVRRALVHGDAVRIVTKCNVFQNKETDISTFLCNFICNLPYYYRIQHPDCVIEFLAKTEELSRVDKDLRIDSMLIASRMLTINEGECHGEVIRKLEKNLKGYIERLDNIIRQEKTQDIFELLANIYCKRDYPRSQLFSEEMYRFLWKAVDNELSKTPQELGKSEQVIKHKIWLFLQQLCQIQHSPTIEDILLQLYNKCCSGDIGQHEHRAVKILVKNFKRYNQEEYFCFWRDELVQLHIDDDLAKELLKAVKLSLQFAQNPRHLLDFSQKMMDVAWQLLQHEQPQISALARSIIYFGETKSGKMQQESEEQSKATNKSYGTASQVLLTPLLISGSRIVQNFAYKMGQNGK